MIGRGSDTQTESGEGAWIFPSKVAWLNLIAESFTWPFKGRWWPAWALGMLAVVLGPIGVVPLLGYAIAATRAAENDPAKGPPRWEHFGRLMSDGFWTALVILLLGLPFAWVLRGPLGEFLFNAHVLRSTDTALAQFYALVLAFFIVALPWGLVMLLFMPHATAAFAASRRPADLFKFSASIRGVRREFATWNVAAAAMVTAWIIGLACIGLLCIGLVPGIFYAILVSAHASAALHHKGPNPPTR